MPKLFPFEREEKSSSALIISTAARWISTEICGYRQCPACVSAAAHIYNEGEFIFLSMASAAENFRSTCGPERGPPECSTQRSPAVAPQVGQGMADICSGVSSFFFIPTECENIGRETVQFCTLYPPLPIGANWEVLRRRFHTAHRN